MTRTQSTSTVRVFRVCVGHSPEEGIIRDRHDCVVALLKAFDVLATLLVIRKALGVEVEKLIDADDAIACAANHASDNHQLRGVARPPGVHAYRLCRRA